MNNYKTLKLACYTSNVTMSVIASLSPLLFLTFRSLYGISFSLLGALVLINFVTQLGIDLIFSFFSHKFNIEKAIRLTPLLATVGILIYAIYPLLLPDTAYVGIVIGTVIFSAASGFGEVLISPIIAAIPSDDPDREMSKLHSVYAWGVVAVVIFSTVFLQIFGRESWHYLALVLLAVPVTSFILFLSSKLPHLETPEKLSGTFSLIRSKKLWICVLAIFLGGAAECTMAQWCSGYLEQSFGIDKLWGDIFGTALFSVMLGIGRTMYSKIGKNIYRVLLLGAIGATLCYFVSVFFLIPIVGLLACAMTGLCVSMLWPGSLIVAEEKNRTSSVFLFAMMAAGGDLGAAIVPQAVGIITDSAITNPTVLSLAAELSLRPEQLTMRLGMLIGMLFPLIGIFVFAKLYRDKKKEKSADALAFDKS